MKTKFKPFKDKIWLSTPTMHRGEEMKYVQKAYDTNWMSTIGENIDAIEEAICQKTGSRYAIGLSAGTSALHLAIKLAGVKPGDKVFCSDLTFSATINPVVYEGGIPVFIDSEYDTWNIDPAALRKAFKIYPEVKMVIMVHLYGTPGKIDEIKQICDEHGATLIEDAAESLGAAYKGKQTGTFGKYGCISFNGNKIITGSSGGMLLSNDKAAIKKAKKWSTQSREDAPWYQHKELGYNYRMSNVIAGVVRGQIPHLEEHISQKKTIYQNYANSFKGLPLSMNPLNLADNQPNYWLSCLTIDQDAMCQQTRTATSASYQSETGKTCPTEILETLAKYNVEGRPIWKPMHLQPIFSDNPFVTIQPERSASEDIFERGLCLPSDIKMFEHDQNIIIEIIKDCFTWSKK